MAGGMNKRGSYGSMADRVGAGPQPTDRPAPTVKHCWVNGRHGRVPGLLLEWRQVDGAWRGRVVRPVDEGDGWVVVEDWVDAALLDPA